MSEQTEHEHETEGDAPVSDDQTWTPEDTASEESEHLAEPEPEPQEASAAVSEADIEKANKLLQKEATAHANRIGKIMGEAANDLLPCPRCWPLTPGFVWPVEAMPVEDEQRQAVLASIGEGTAGAPPLREAEGVVMCARCDGWGELTFPTRREHTKRQSCPACNGSGYTLAPEPATNVSPIISSTTTTGVANVSVIPSCERCGQPGMQGQPHWCAPAVSAGA